MNSRRSDRQPASARKQTPNPLLLRVKGAEKNTWEAVLMSFTAMYAYVCEELCVSSLEASEKNGFCEEDGVRRPINLNQFRDVLASEKTLQHAAWRRPLAMSLKVGEQMQEIVEDGMRFWHIVCGSLCVACPQVASLYGDGSKARDLIQRGEVSSKFLTDLGVKEDIVDRIAAFASSQIETARGACTREVRNQILSVLDMSLADSPAGMSEEQVEEFLSKLPATYSSTCCAFLQQYVPLASSLVGPTPTGLGDVAKLVSQIKSTSQALNDFKAADGEEAVAAFFGVPERQKGIEVLLTTKAQGMALHYEQLCNKLVEESGKLAARLKKTLAKVPVEEEQKMLSHMANSAQDIAKQKNELSQRLAKIRTVFEKTGRDLPQDHAVAEQVAGAGMYLVAFYTAVALYRSSLYGKKSTPGKQTQEQRQIDVECCCARACVSNRSRLPGFKKSMCLRGISGSTATV